MVCTIVSDEEAPINFAKHPHKYCGILRRQAWWFVSAQKYLDDGMRVFQNTRRATPTPFLQNSCCNNYSILLPQCPMQMHFHIVGAVFHCDICGRLHTMQNVPICFPKGLSLSFQLSWSISQVLRKLQRNSCKNFSGISEWLLRFREAHIPLLQLLLPC